MTSAVMVLGLLSIGNTNDAQAVEAAPAWSLAELTQLYVSVDREEAVAHVAVLTQSEVEAETQGLLETLEAVALAEDATQDEVEQAERTLRAAAALLSDAAGRALYRGDMRRPRWELDNAARLVRGMRPSARGGGFARRFYLLAGLMLHGIADLAAAHEMLSEGQQLAGDDPELLLALGAVSETIAALRTYDLPDGARRPPDVLDRPGFVIEGRTGEGGPLPQATLADAQALYSKALQRDSGLLEARLRLGRVLLLRGKPQEALPELQRVGRESSRPSQCYLARLFEGRAREQLGDLQGAAAAFTEAGTLAPGAQSALVALGRALDRLGEGARSQAAFDEAMLRETEAQLDPWWDYMRGQPDRIKDVLEELRGQVP
jgi:tetratricopeptide (TPR) repeat protein